MAILLCLAFALLGMVEMKGVEPVQKRAAECYDKLGCFSTDPPFTDSNRPIAYAPESPDVIQTKFNLYTREAKTTAQVLDARHPERVGTVWTHYKVRPTQFIVHGFLDNPTLSPWLNEMKDELLKHGDYNVVVTDWSKGNLFPYTQATANTRVVGAQIALVINELISNHGASANDFHVIGHSLGSHIAGYAGERVPNMRRITGLDPAGPYFAGTDKTVRLDPSDALFVDNIHTDDVSILQLGLGMEDAIGNSDFYPNLGHDQPGCTRDPFINIATYGLVQGVEEVAACNHLRSIKFFTESINSACPFLAFPCASEQDFAANRCHSCTSAGCASMGFNADQHIPSNGHTKYYLTTSNKAPFCQYHLEITLKFSSTDMIEERGEMNAVVIGDKGSTPQITLVDDDNSKVFRPGSTITFYVGVPAEIGNVQSVRLGWSHVSSFTDPLHWNLLGLRTPKLYLDEIDILREEANADVHFCMSHQSVNSDQSISVNTKC